MTNNILVDVLQETLKNEDYVIKVRRHLHENPEISLKEFQTIQYITNELISMGIEYELVPNGGIIGYIHGTKPSKKLILRADMDALPMQESSYNLLREKEVVSKVDGAAHTCGHDAHTAMLLGAAKILSANKEIIEGTVILAFEQAEEIGGGIYHLLKRLVEIDADGIWGIHLKSDLQAGKISVEAGPRMASAFAFEVEIEGKSGHGSRPDLSFIPLDCFTDFYTNLKGMRLNVLDPFKAFTISIGSIQYGSAMNIIPQTLTFSGTARFLEVEQGAAAAEYFKKLLDQVCKLHNCTYKYIKEPKAMNLSVTNNAACSRIAAAAVSKVLGEDVHAHYPAWMASEPFSMYQKYFPGVFAFLGIENKELGTGAEHHNEHFDMDESSLKIGVASTVQYAVDFLVSKEQIPFTKVTVPFDDLFKENGFIIEEE